MTFQYLKEDQYYIDQYDLHTIEECVDFYKSLKGGMYKNRHKLKDTSDSEFERQTELMVTMVIRTMMLERYKNKAATIEKWKINDSRRQSFLDTTQPPKGIYCKVCGGNTKMIDKHLMEEFQKPENDKIVFMFECLDCEKRSTFDHRGNVWGTERDLCSKCSTELKSKSSKRNEVLTVTDTCPKCHFTNSHTYDFTKSNKESEERERRNKQLLAQYREELCYDNVTGQKALEEAARFDELTKMVQEQKTKESSPAYKIVQSLTKLNIVALEKRLSKVLPPNKYLKFKLGEPELNRHLAVDFSVQDGNSSRQDRDSINNLKKIIREDLRQTNWRLVSDSIIYKLGFLTGRLKGYDREEDLMQLIEKENKY